MCIVAHEELRPREAEGPAQGHQSSSETSRLVWLLVYHRAGFWQVGRVGDASTQLWDLKIFSSFSFFCFLTVVPDLPLPPEDVTAAAPVHPPAGPARVHSPASVGGHETRQGAVGLRNSPKPIRTPTSSGFLLKSLKGGESLYVPQFLYKQKRKWWGEEGVNF